MTGEGYRCVLSFWTSLRLRNLSLDELWYFTCCTLKMHPKWMEPTFDSDIWSCQAGKTGFWCTRLTLLFELMPHSCGFIFWHSWRYPDWCFQNPVLRSLVCSRRHLQTHISSCSLGMSPAAGWHPKCVHIRCTSKRPCKHLLSSVWLGYLLRRNCKKSVHFRLR